MASCGEVDHSVDSLSSSKVEDGGDAFTGDSPSSPTPSANPVPECAICLQTCVHPVRLPCRHVFCFLCVKGASWHSKRCALCRQEVPEDFMEHPTLLSPEELKAAAAGGRGGTGPGSAGGDHAWYYEGRNGWWQYDERTSRELEDAFAKGRKSAEMLIAGFLYVADLENMVQYRRNEHGRRRRMKRDVVDIPKKGVAGLRLDPDPTPPVVAVAAVPVTAATVERPSSADGEDLTGRSQAGGLGVVIPAPPVRPPTVLGAHPATSVSISLEDSLSQLLISQPEGEEEENEEVASRISQVYESASGSSEDEDGGGDEVGRGWGRERGDGKLGLDGGPDIDSYSAGSERSSLTDCHLEVGPPAEASVCAHAALTVNALSLRCDHNWTTVSALKQLSKKQIYSMPMVVLNNPVEDTRSAICITYTAT